MLKNNTSVRESYVKVQQISQSAKCTCSARRIKHLAHWLCQREGDCAAGFTTPRRGSFQLPRFHFMSASLSRHPRITDDISTELGSTQQVIFCLLGWNALFLVTTPIRLTAASSSGLLGMLLGQLVAACRSAAPGEVWCGRGRQSSCRWPTGDNIVSASLLRLY